MKYGLHYLLLALALLMGNGFISGENTLDKNGLLYNLAGSLGSLTGSFILAGFVAGYMSLPKRKFIGFKRWNLVTLIVSILVMAWGYYNS